MADFVNSTRRATVQDVSRITSIHLRSFPTFFLTFLGPVFLARLYRSLIEDGSGLVFVYQENNEILGFVAGTIHPSGFYRRLISHRLFHFCLASIVPVIKRPAIIPRLLRALSKPRASGIDEGCAKLMSIAVHPDAQGRGFGKKLLLLFLNESKKLGCMQVDLETDRLNNDAVNHFYLANGFFLLCSYVTPEGREMNEYRIDLSSWNNEKD